MSKKPSNKIKNKKLASYDYFVLPFEVYYSEYVQVTMLDFQSDIPVKNFKDIKLVRREEGGSWGLNLYCPENKGPELYCCINNLHEEVVPDWLKFLDEESLDFSSVDMLAVNVVGDKIKFRHLTDEEQDSGSADYLDIENMDICCSDTFLTYTICDSSPDYIILDADDSRIKVNLDGYVLDDDNNETEERIFNPEELKEEDFEDYSGISLWEAKANWVNSILKNEFPKETHLKLSLNIE